MEEQQTLIIVVILIVFCCCVSAGIGAYIMFNDKANAWFKRTFGIDDEDPVPDDNNNPPPDDFGLTLPDTTLDTGTQPAAGGPPAGNPPAGNPPAGNPPAGNPPAGTPAGGWVCPKPWSQTADATSGQCSGGGGQAMKAKDKASADKIIGTIKGQLAGLVTDTGISYGPCPCDTSKKSFLVPLRYRSAANKNTVTSMACYDDSGNFMKACNAYCQRPSSPYTNETLATVPDASSTQCCNYKWVKKGTGNEYENTKVCSTNSKPIWTQRLTSNGPMTQNSMISSLNSNKVVGLKDWFDLGYRARVESSCCNTDNTFTHRVWKQGESDKYRCYVFDKSTGGYLKSHSCGL